MNIPRSKPIVRHKKLAPHKLRQRGPLGAYAQGIHNPDFSFLVGQIVAYLPYIEEQMIEVMAILMGDRSSPARQVFRSLNSEDARVKVMRSLLEQAPSNKNKGQEFDEIIDLFVEVKKKRNIYAHGLWATHLSSGRVFIQEASTDAVMTFLSRREVKIGELKASLSRMAELWAKTVVVIFANKPQPLP